MGCVWSSIPVAIFKPLPQTHIYLCLYFINNLFLDQAKSYKDFQQLKEEKARRKKTIKKLVNYSLC